MSSKEIWLCPLTCHRPVIPGSPRGDGDASSDTVEFIGKCGARTDQTHVATNYVQELRQLVDAEAAQYPADASDPRIIAKLEYLAVGATFCFSIRRRTSKFAHASEDAFARDVEA